ncbi:MAG: hypothetical protein QM500_02390 [Methylococcales bacterium]
MDDSVSRFWDKYIEKSKTYHIKNTSVRWYVMRIEEYIEANKGVRLTRHNADDISHYLQEIGRKGYLKDWQYRQVVLALKILFVAT